LDFYVVPDRDLRTDYNVLPEVTIAPQFRSGHDVRKVPNLCPLPDFARLVDDGS
jgi:hypothetical protein